MKRRNVLLGLGATGVAAAVMLRPSDRGGGYSDYFRALNDTLKKSGPYRPALLVDLDKLDRNIAALRQIVPASMAYRLVAKSLPSPALLDYVMTRAQTRRLMVFHQPFLSSTAVQFPDTDVLLGKPMPVKAAAAFYRDFKPASGVSAFDPQRQLQWLIDTHERLVQYHELARGLGVRMRINIELDVGLHRGGLKSPEQLKPLMDLILANPQQLEWAGFMGYDPHVVKLPRLLRSPQQAYAQSQAIYRSFIAWIAGNCPAAQGPNVCFNGAGSPSMALHREGSVINDLAAGSCLVKPTDFDIPTLDTFEPAAYIATPVLKKSAGIELPALESLRNFAAQCDPNLQRTYFIYGGKWLAKLESPQGLSGNELYGTSSNQEIVNGSARTALEVDDHVFLRPTQSEAVFLEFGDILAVRGGQIESAWPVLTQ